MDPQTPRAKAALTMLMQDLMEAISAAGNCLFSSYDVFPAALLNRPNGLLDPGGQPAAALGRRPRGPHPLAALDARPPARACRSPTRWRR